MDEEAVSPVLGTVFVIALTTLGIVLVLVAGGPAIERLNGVAAQNTVASEFDEVRLAAAGLSLTDAARTVPVSIPSGELQTRAGSPLLVSVSYQPGCDLRITGWSDGDDAYTTSSLGCTGTTTLYRLQGGQRVPVVGTPDVSMAEDWVWQVAAGATINAEAFLLRQDRLEWSRASSEGSAAVMLEAGATFVRSGSPGLRSHASIQGDQETAGAVLVSLPSLRTEAGQGVAPGARSVHLRVDGTAALVAQDAYRLRIETRGELAPTWCSALLLRNSYSLADQWVEDAAAGDTTVRPACDSPRLDGTVPHYAATYRRNAAATTAFPLSLHHAVIDVHIDL